MVVDLSQQPWPNSRLVRASGNWRGCDRRYGAAAGRSLCPNRVFSQLPSI